MSNKKGYDVFGSQLEKLYNIRLMDEECSTAIFIGREGGDDMYATWMQKKIASTNLKILKH